MFRPGRYIDSKSAYVQSSKAKRERERERGGARKSQRPALDAFKAFPNVSRDDL